MYKAGHYYHFRDILTILICTLCLCTPGIISAQIFADTTSESVEAPPEFAEDSLGRRTPRGTVTGFMRAVSNQNYSRASRYFNLKPEVQNSREGERLVRVLQILLDRGGRFMPYSWISDKYEGRPEDDLPPEVDRVGTVTADGESLDLYVEQIKGPEGGPIWLFSSVTIQSIASISLEETSLVEKVMPETLETTIWGGVPAGHWIAAILLAIFSYLIAWLIIWFFSFLIKVFWQKARNETNSGIIKALSLPFKLYLAVWIYVELSREVGISIIVRQRFSSTIVIIAIVAFVILLWRLIDFLGTFSKSQLSKRGNISGVSAILFFKRAAKIAIVIIGIIMILGTIGVNVTAGIAALGIGGIALALGAQKTIENFVGSVTVIADQPVRVGDFCKVGDTIGTIEKIGMRSTRIRTHDRTLVTIPNGQFSSEKIENYAHRDRFFFNTVLDFRYETTPDQIRFLLVEIREILYSHPMVNPVPARVRFKELGASSIKIEIFSYIDAPNFDVYVEVKEDLLLRIMDKVAESGTDFAFPSQTVYLARDKGLSEDKIQKAEDKVKEWKKDRKMQLPSFDEKRIEELKNSIKYPPEGSVKHKDEGEELF